MYKLKVELVPESCWYSNLRCILKPQLWDFVRKDAYSRAHGKCMICGKETSRLEAHEQWSYDVEKRLQKLEDVIAVCAECHSVIHIGRTSLKGDIEKAEDHFMKVNGCTYTEMKKLIGKANEENAIRNRVPEWQLDLTWLKRYC